MHALVTFLLGVLDHCRAVLGMIFTVFAEAADFRRWPGWLKAVVHLTVLGLIVYGLYLLNPFVLKWLQVRCPELLKPVYLPVLFLLVYALLWFAYLFWRAWTAADAVPYPDVKADWDAAVAALRRGGVSLARVPVVLAIGRPAAGEDALLAAAGRRGTVQAGGPAVQVFADRELILVTCPAASGWSAYTDAVRDPRAVGSAADDRKDARGRTVVYTLMPDQALDGVPEDDRKAFYALLDLQSERPLTDDEQDRLNALGQVINGKRAGAVARVNVPAEVAAAGPHRLAYLCRLIAADRHPSCPVNGALVLLPWAAFQTNELAGGGIAPLADDLDRARAAVGQVFPTFAVVCDLETAAGFARFQRGFTDAERARQRIGQRLPVVPDAAAERAAAVTAAGVDLIRRNSIGYFTLRKLDLPQSTGGTGGRFVPEHNEQRLRFLHQAYNRLPRVGRLLARLPGDPYPMLGGCYLAATGADADRQAFARGALDRLVERASQSAVAWTAATVAADRAARRRARVLWAAAAALLAAALWCGWVIYANTRAAAAGGQ